MMSVIISIETATTVCSVALHQGDDLLALRELDEEKSHSIALAGMIKEVIFESGLTTKDLRAVAISQGPGSYTGLRIGTATAKGLCFSLDLPLIAVSTLKAMAKGVNPLNQDKAWLCPMLDARRMEVYCWLSDDGLNEITPVKAKVISSESFEKELEQHRLMFFGNGAAKCKTLLGNNPNAIFVDGFKPSASFIGDLARERYLNNNFEDLAYFEPIYLKEFHTTQPKTRIH